MTQDAQTEEQQAGCGCFVFPWTEVARYQHWRVFLNRNQDYLGKCIIALARHEEDFLALTAREREEMWEVTARLREGLRKLFTPDHFNYQVLGNEVRHVHMHLTPRYREAREFAGERFVDEHWGTWPYPSERKQPREWVEGLVEALKTQLSA